MPHPYIPHIKAAVCPGCWRHVAGGDVHGWRYGHHLWHHSCILTGTYSDPDGR